MPAAPENREAGPRPPIAALATVLAASLALLLGIGFTLTDVRRQMGLSRQQDALLEDLTGRIRYLDEVLTSSAYMYAGTGDPRWRARYWANDPLLSQALRELSMVSPRVYREFGGEMVAKVNDELVAIEERSMAATTRGDRTAALGELDSDEYVGLKKRYSAGLEEITGALRADLGRSADEQYRGLWSLVSMSVGAVLLAGAWCVWLVSRTHKRALGLADSMTLTIRQSERETRKLALVTSKTDNAVFITDASGRIEWVNDAFVRLSGQTLEDVRGASVLPMYRCPGEEGDGSARLDECVLEGRGFRGELLCRTAGGRRYWASLELEPIRDELGCVVQFFAVQRDITVRREAADRLERSNAAMLEVNRKLEEQARALEAQAVELDRARREAEAASRAKSEFLANMSHEIRTPLNGVIGALDLMERTGLNARQERFCRMARTSGGALLSLINDILDCSKLDAGAVELENIDFSLGAVCAEITEMFAQRVEEKGITLSCEVSPALPTSLKGDPTRLRQVLLNLVSNAIKFTREGGVVLRVTPERRVGEHIEVRLTITDSGIGIPSDRIDRLFKSFSQIDASTTRRYGGTGLGLSICKSLVTLMGGEIGVASEEGRGSTFYVTVPLGLSTGGGDAGSAGTWRIQDLRVLALAESDDERNDVDALLESWGFKHEVGRADDAAVEMLLAAAEAGRPFDLVLLSAGSVSEALEFSLGLTSHPLLGHTAVLLMVAMGADSELQVKRLRASGAAAWVQTPVSDSDLLDAIVGATAACRRAVSATPPQRKGVVRKARAARDVRVLVAEDNEVNQIITTELLREAGMEAQVARDGRRAVEEAGTGRYDLVLMDCQMPEVDGLEASRQIRKAEESGHVFRRGGGRLPIVALTANALPEDRNKCLVAGMDEYLTKPLDADELIGTIERLCPGSQERPESDSSAAPLPAAVPAPLDVEDLRRRCRGKTALMTTILGKFRESLKKSTVELEAALAHADLEGAARLSHTLKGAAASVGAAGVAEAAAGIERAAKAGDTEGAALGRASLTRQATMLERAIAEALTTLSTPAATQETHS